MAQCLFADCGRQFLMQLQEESLSKKGETEKKKSRIGEKKLKKKKGLSKNKH